MIILHFHFENRNVQIDKIIYISYTGTLQTRHHSNENKNVKMDKIIYSSYTGTLRI